MRYIPSLIFAVAISVGTKANGQGMAVNTSGSTADASAMLDVSSTSKGLLIPRMTQAERTAISSPATALMVYQTDGTAGFYYYNGSSWAQVGGGGTPTGPAGGALSGTYPNPTIASGAVGATELAVNSVSTSKIIAGSVTMTKIAATGTASATTYLRGDGQWAPPPSGGGSSASGSSPSGVPYSLAARQTNSTGTFYISPVSNFLFSSSGIQPAGTVMAFTDCTPSAKISAGGAAGNFPMTVEIVTLNYNTTGTALSTVGESVLGSCVIASQGGSCTISSASTAVAGKAICLKATVPANPVYFINSFSCD